MYFEGSFNVIMPLSAHGIVLHQETFCQVAVLNCANNKLSGSDSRSLDQHWLLSRVEPIFYLPHVDLTRLAVALAETPQ